MRAAARLVDGYVVAAMLAAAVGGRLLDAAAVLPGVDETAALRGGTVAWVMALLVAAVVGVSAAKRWQRTQRLAAVTYVVVPGQVFAFLAAEAVVRLANGQGPLDPDGFVGAGLQAAFGLVLLLALTALWVVAEQCRPRHAVVPMRPAANQLQIRRTCVPAMRVLLLEARGPPMTAGT
ncbi:MAG: hypothetical protein QOI82_868 [Actinomycetota bacterium]|jgi:hypothetical protein|nr:hypothetical protein [Actinomycetota bacterium]